MAPRTDSGRGPSPLRRLGRRFLKTRVTVALYRAGAVRETLRFAWRETFGRPGRRGEYRLRVGGRCALRHRSVDMEIFHELVFGDVYVPPAEARQALAGLQAPRVLDLGANIGLYGVLALRLWPQARIEGFEPDPANRELLERCIALNAAGDRWTVVPAFAAARDGEVPFLAGGQSLSRRARPHDSGDVITVPAVDVMPRLEHTDVLKVDIEGAEWDLLEDERLRSSAVRIVAMEYHGGADSDPQGRAESLLTSAGFRTRTVHREDEIGVGLIWGWRRGGSQ